MINSLLFNVFTAFFGFFLVVIISIKTNTLETSFIRGLLSLILFFFLGFGLRWVIKYVLKDTINKNDSINLSKQRDTKDKVAYDGSGILRQSVGTSHDPASLSSQSDNDEGIGESFEGDLYERTSEYVRELLNEDDQN
ncbi:hypothetical protein [Calidifontibacillus oryziterrae]|uniref:hypothetical protein n=1 Tax=Calidifontibacillus oryziterrae TaxID=1191699 RepID=UPI000361F124|nr:hypothetical protein [Calidifontibacillus oryziterrae]